MVQGTCAECSAPTNRQCCCLTVFYCSQACQSTAWPEHRARCPVTKVKDLIGRGRGLVAARPIPRGTTVIYEKPLIAVKKKPGVDLEIWKQYKQLSKEERKFYDSLGPDKANKQEMVASIFWEHCVKLGSEDLRAMYSRFALVNHSCAGNALVSYSERGHLQLVVVKRVEKEEEITVNYLDPYIYRGKEDFFKVNRQANLQKYWKFTCACQVCAASPQQEAANDGLKRNMLAYVAKQKKYESENLRGNLNLIFTLEVAILGLMRKLEAEMIREMPECLLRCYRFGKLVQVFEGRVVEDVGKYLQEGRRLAAILGPTHGQAFKIREGMIDREREQAVQWLVEEKRSKMCYMVAIPASEIATPSLASETDNKQVVTGRGKGRGRGRRITSTSQGV